MKEHKGLLQEFKKQFNELYFQLSQVPETKLRTATDAELVQVFTELQSKPHYKVIVDANLDQYLDRVLTHYLRSFESLALNDLSRNFVDEMKQAIERMIKNIIKRQLKAPAQDNKISNVAVQILYDILTDEYLGDNNSRGILFYELMNAVEKVLLNKSPREFNENDFMAIIQNRLANPDLKLSEAAFEKLNGSIVEMPDILKPLLTNTFDAVLSEINLQIHIIFSPEVLAALNCQSRLTETLNDLELQMHDSIAESIWIVKQLKVIKLKDTNGSTFDFDKMNQVANKLNFETFDELNKIYNSHRENIAKISKWLRGTKKYFKKRADKGGSEACQALLERISDLDFSEEEMTGIISDLQKIAADAHSELTKDQFDFNLFTQLSDVINSIYDLLIMMHVCGSSNWSETSRSNIGVLSQIETKILVLEILYYGYAYLDDKPFDRASFILAMHGRKLEQDKLTKICDKMQSVGGFMARHIDFKFTSGIAFQYAMYSKNADSYARVRSGSVSVILDASKSDCESESPQRGRSQSLAM